MSETTLVCFDNLEKLIKDQKSRHTESLLLRIADRFVVAIELANARGAAAQWREVARLAMAMAEEREEECCHRVTLIVPGDVVKDLSPNQRMNWHVKANRTKKWREMVLLAWRSKGEKPFAPGVRLKITVRRGRVVDRINLVSSCKAVEDGLWVMAQKHPDPQGAALLGDSGKWVRELVIEQETGKQWRDSPEVVIEITGEPLCE